MRRSSAASPPGSNIRTAGSMMHGWWWACELLLFAGTYLGHFVGKPAPAGWSYVSLEGERCSQVRHDRFAKSKDRRRSTRCCFSMPNTQTRSLDKMKPTDVTGEAGQAGARKGRNASLIPSTCCCYASTTTGAVARITAPAQESRPQSGVRLGLSPSAVNHAPVAAGAVVSLLRPPRR